MSRRPFALLPVALIAAACIKMGPTADVTRYFVLAPVAESAATTTANGPVIGVGPVTIPSYLDRNAIVTRVGPSEVNPAETHRWAEPFRSMLQQTLAANLTAELGASRALTYPWRRNLEPSIVVEVDVRRFEPATDGTVTLEAGWAVTAGGQEQHGTTMLTEPTGVAGPDAQVAAMSRLLGQLSAELAEAARR